MPFGVFGRGPDDRHRRQSSRPCDRLLESETHVEPAVDRPLPGGLAGLEMPVRPDRRNGGSEGQEWGSDFCLNAPSNGSAYRGEAPVAAFQNMTGAVPGNVAAHADQKLRWTSSHANGGESVKLDSRLPQGGGGLGSLVVGHSPRGGCEAFTSEGRNAVLGAVLEHVSTCCRLFQVCHR